MKIFALLTILIIVFCKTFTHSPVAQRKGYELSINQGSTTKPKDTTVFWGKKQYRYFTVPVKLTNLTNTKLVYTSFTCSTFVIFTTTNKDVEIELQPCQKNIPTELEVGAHQSSITNLRLFIPKKTGEKYRFAVGMYLRTSSADYSIDTLLNRNLWAKNMIIWSNEVTIPK